MRTLPTASFLAVLLLASSSAAQNLSLDDVLARAGGYATNYNRAIVLIAADERADDVARGFGIQSSDSPGMEVAGKTDIGLMRGTIVIASNDKGWQAFRDYHEVNTRVIHDKKDRLERLFRDRGPAADKEIAAISTLARRSQVGTMPRMFNVPTFSLMFLFPRNQPRFAFRKTGEKKVDNEPVWVVAFEETRSPTLIVTSNGEEYPAHGELWIEPKTGRLVKSRMIVENTKPAEGSQTEAEKYRPRVTVDVTYQFEPTLNVWVPVEMKELYVRATEQVTCKARYTNFRLITP